MEQPAIECREIPRDESLLLSVIVPAYNEAATIETLLDRVVAAPYPKQVIVVDDGSRDGTATAVEAWQARSSVPGVVELLVHDQNRGKGAAVRTGLRAARGQVVIVQDADLEYEPGDYPLLIEPILKGEADAVYGSRYLQATQVLPWTLNRVGVHFLNCIVFALYGQRITDEATCYKAFHTDVLRRMDLRCERFEFCPEVTAKACRMGIAIREVPIRYHPRTVLEGKKIGWWDGVEAARTLLYWRFSRFQPLAGSEAAPNSHSVCVQTP